ncbi:MAG: protein kinase domain-containing protein [Gemmatimonadales bacterium]
MDDLQTRLESVLGSGYLLQQELTGGGMSRVFVAHDITLDRRVVVKVLAPERAGELSTERFRKEALLAASLQHPHIVPILATGAVGGMPYLIMPFVDGRSLRDRLDREGRLPLRDAVRILLDVARACAYAHERGIVHRDIKPDNVLMSGDAAMITDFGVAKAVAAGGRGAVESRLTQEGFTVGSPRYMAPEQATGDPDIDHRVDIYSFGVLAFELVAGEPPFNSPSSAELLRSHLTVRPLDLRSVRADVPPAFAQLVNQCLAKRRDDRPPNAAALVTALEDPGIVSSSRSRRAMAALPAGNRLWYSVAAVVAIVALGIIAWRTRGSAAPARIDSIAVLPVIDRTADSASEWMATGLTDEVTAVLGRTPGLRVAARRLVERFRSDTASPTRIAEVLGVRSVLDATLTRTDSSNYQLAAQLIDASDGLVLWSASIRGSRSDVLALQDSVIAGVLQALGRAPDTVATSVALEDPVARRAAWAEYLRGRDELRQRGSSHLRLAISHFADALRTDAMLPQAYAGLADAWTLLPLYDPSAGQQPLSRALDAVNHALALDPHLPEARAARGHLLVGLWQWSDAETDLRAAIAANGTLTDARQWLGEVLLLTGRHAEAVRELTAARALDPTSPVVVAIQGLALGVDGQFDAARAAVAAAERLDPSFAEAELFEGAVDLFAGQPAAAIAVLQRGAALGPTDPILLGLLGQAYAMAGNTAQSRAVLTAVDTLPLGIPRHGARAHVALGLHDTTTALAELEQAAADREPIFAAEPLGTPLFASIRHAPRFTSLLVRLGFLPAAITAIQGYGASH